MPSTKRFAHTDLSAPGTLVLEIGGTPYEVVQFNGSWAVNEIPRAQCLIAVGRDAQSRDAAALAAVNTANDYRQMTPCVVRFHPRGEYDPLGTMWPDGEQVIFEGLFTGFAYRKAFGKIVVVANMVHWLADLACSSCLVKNAVASNPSQLSVAAVLARSGSAGVAGAAVSRGGFVFQLAMSSLITSMVADDLWGAIKKVFCTMASMKTAPAGSGPGCEKAAFQVNDRALRALAKFEGGGAGACPFEQPPGETAAYAVPLALANTGLDAVPESLSRSISDEMLAAYASHSFWDKLVGQFCPQFAMAVVPMARRALVIADTPAYGAAEWKTIAVTEHDSYDFNAALERPLRGVGVVAGFYSATTADAAPGDLSGVGTPLIGGCFVAPTVSQDDGLVQFVEAPPWLQKLHVAGVDAYKVSPPGAPTRSAGARAAGTPPPVAPSTVSRAANTLFQRYAHAVYAGHTLRGRQGSLSGKLRFDIAPGSVVRIVSSPELHSAGRDNLAFDLVACVQRVSVTISAEGPAAGTSFLLTHMRTANENEDPRTSVDEHPLFGGAIHGGGKHGAPLVPAYDI